MSSSCRRGRSPNWSRPPAFLHVHHHIREDGQTLYGFADPRGAGDVPGPHRHPRCRSGGGDGDPRHPLTGGIGRHRRRPGHRRPDARSRRRAQDRRAAARRVEEPVVGPRARPVGARRRWVGDRRRPRGARGSRLCARRDPRHAARAAGGGRCRGLLRDALKLLGARVRDEFLESGVADDGEDAVEAGLRPRCSPTSSASAS